MVKYNVNQCRDGDKCPLCKVEKTLKGQTGIIECPICGADNCYEKIHMTLENNPHKNLEFDYEFAFRSSIYLHDIKNYSLVSQKDHDDLERLESFPGVYALYSDSQKKHCWYVGHTTSIYDRIRKHLKGDPTTKQRNLYHYFKYVEVFELNFKDKHHLALLEQMVIAYRSPYHNLTSKGIAYLSKKELQQKLDSHIEESRPKWSTSEKQLLDQLWLSRKSSNWRQKAADILR
ncbi:GIY-YIG nuclease family protein [Bacillus hominis]|uniref:GIY-YIG nuclease family protein n=1 Tax=Bacillus hominis TaxID=2817478 RepID=UPI003D65A2C4